MPTDFRLIFYAIRRLLLTDSNFCSILFLVVVVFCSLVAMDQHLHTTTITTPFWPPRVPVVCTDRLNTIEALLPCLAPEAASHDRRQALLLLNNLCIPEENKRHMLLGEIRDALLFSLLHIFQRRLAESHIAAACLYNLSFLEEAKLMLIPYTPPATLTAALMMTTRTRSAQSSYGFQSPTANKDSLLRIVEDLVVTFTPSIRRGHEKQVSTVEAATVRWCMALMRNLVTVQDNAAIVAGTTKFPFLAAHVLDESDRDLAYWTRDSLEDSSLLLLLLLVQSGSESCLVMEKQAPEIRTMCEKVSKYPGIHGVRADAILQRLDQARDPDNTTAIDDDNDRYSPNHKKGGRQSSYQGGKENNHSDPRDTVLLKYKEEHKEDPVRHYEIETEDVVGDPEPEYDDETDDDEEEEEEDYDRHTMASF